MVFNTENLFKCPYFNTLGGMFIPVSRRREPVSPRQERSTPRGHHDRFRRDRIYLRRSQRDSRREVLESPPTPSQLSVDVDVPQKLAILLDSPSVSTTESLEHSWSPTDKSFNILLKEDDQMIMRRHPIAQSTDCVRGKQGYSSGLHMWAVKTHNITDKLIKTSLCYEGQLADSSERNPRRYWCRH